VLLVLLIFFMTSSSFVASGGLDVKLPNSNNQSKSRTEESLRVNVLQDGTIEFDGKRTRSSEELAKILQPKFQTGADQVVVVRADELAEHRYVVAAMDGIKSAGFEKVAIATKLTK